MQDTKPNKLPYIVGGVVVAALLFLMLCVRTVGVGQVGIVTRFGNVTREQQSGIMVKWPFPIEHLTKMNVKTQKEQQDASAATHDLQTVTATVAMNYNLTSKTALDVYRQIGTNYQATVIDPVLQNSIKAVTSQYDASDLIVKRSEVAQKLNDLLVDKLTDKGVTVSSVNIVNFDFSKQFNDSIEAKQVAQQNAQKAQYDLQTAQLTAQANSVQSAALSDQILEQQAIKQWNGVMPTTIAGDSTIFNIPLK